MSAPVAGGGERPQEEWYEFGCARLNDAADVQRIAHLAIQRVEHRGFKSHGVSRLVGDKPGAACSVQAYGYSRLASHGPKLRHRLSRSPSHCQRQPVVREQRPPSRVLVTI